MSWFAWIIFGALAGWLANIIVHKPDRRRGCLTNILVGIIGSALGGFVYRAVTDTPWDFTWSLPSFGVAILGAIVLLVVVNLASPRR